MWRLGAQAVMSYVIFQHTATHCNALQHTATHCRSHGNIKVFIRPVVSTISFERARFRTWGVGVGSFCLLINITANMPMQGTEGILE